MNENDQSAHQIVRDMEASIKQVLLGKPEPIRLVLTALLADGHVLIEDVPGLGKTMLIRSLARSIDGSYSRIQFTPDLLPGDVTGSHIYNQQSGEFQFDKGPIFAQVLLADEINRATPRTQSALLESMEERQATIDGETFDLPDSFFVAATQNPVEQQGTFPLPEAQLDRFLLKFDIGYPDDDIERDVASLNHENHPVQDVDPVCSPSDVLRLQQIVQDIDVEESVMKYLVDLVRESREIDAVELGASPRGSIALRRASQAYAFIEGRDYVTPDDVKALLPATLRHRIILDPKEKMAGTTVEDVIEEIKASVSVPVQYEPAPD